jgi:flotillin
MSTSVELTTGIVVAAVLLLVLVFKAMWKVAEPNQALIISGAHDKDANGGMGFRVVTGGGTLVLPGVQVVRRLSLDINEAELAVQCVTKQGIRVGVRGVVIFRWVTTTRRSRTRPGASSTSSPPWCPRS